MTNEESKTNKKDEFENYNKLDKDPEVIETIEDGKIASKLQKERELNYSNINQKCKIVKIKECEYNEKDNLKSKMYKFECTKYRVRASRDGQCASFCLLGKIEKLLTGRMNPSKIFRGSTKESFWF